MGIRNCVQIFAVTREKIFLYEKIFIYTSKSIRICKIVCDLKYFFCVFLYNFVQLLKK